MLLNYIDKIGNIRKITIYNDSKNGKYKRIKKYVPLFCGPVYVNQKEEINEEDAREIIDFINFNTWDYSGDFIGMAGYKIYRKEPKGMALVSCSWFVDNGFNVFVLPGYMLTDSAESKILHILEEQERRQKIKKST